MLRRILLLPVLLAPLGVMAQQPLPLPGERSSAAVDSAASRAKYQPGEMVPIELQTASVKVVMEYYEALTGKRVIYDVQAIGDLSIVATVTREEAIMLIERTLIMNGFMLVPVDDKFVKLLGIARNPRAFGIPLISDELQIPDGEQVVSYLIKLKFADPTEVATLISAYVGQSQYTQALAMPKSQGVLVTENSLIIKRILQVVREVDVPPAEVVSEFITLQRADAKDVLEKLEKIFDKGQTPQGGTAGAGAIAIQPKAARTTPEGNPIPADATATATGPNSVEINGGALSEDSIIIGKIKLTADTRTNRMHVVTRPVNLRFIRTLIREFDADVPFGEPSIRPLRFVAAGDILSTIVDAITEPGQKDNGSSGGSKSSGTDSNRNRNTGTGSGDLFSNNSNSNSGFGSNGNSSGGGGGVTLSESLSTSERDVVPEARIIGNTKIIADKRANSIIVLGNKQVKEKIFALLDELDVRAPQVMIHTVIGELNLSNNEKFGVQYILNNGKRNGLLGTTVTGSTSTNGTGGTTDGTGTGSTANGSNGALAISNGSASLNLNGLLSTRNISQLAAAGANGFSGFVAAGSAFNAIIDALEATNKFRVVSRPSIFTSNNKRAIIASGEEIAVPSNITGGFSGSNTANNGLVTQSSITYKTVALQLEVLPLINSEREVTLEVVQKIDQQSGSDTISGNAIPRIATRALSTTVTVPSDGTLVLGGLIKQTDNRTTSGIPYLSRIPLVGPLFRTTSRDKGRTELVVLIRPVVTNGPAEDYRNKERTLEAMTIEPDIEATIYPPNLRKKTRFDSEAGKIVPVAAPKAPALRKTATLRD